VVGKLLSASASELLGEPDPFDPISADRTEDIPSLPLASYEDRLPLGLSGPTLDDPAMTFDTGLTAPMPATAPSSSPGSTPGVKKPPDTFSDPTDPETRSGDKTRVADLTKRRACFVSDDAPTRRLVENDTRGLLESFYTEVSLAHVLDVGAEIDDVLLYRPKSDARTHELLARLAKEQPRTRVVLIGAQAGLEAGGAGEGAGRGRDPAGAVRAGGCDGGRARRARPPRRLTARRASTSPRIRDPHVARRIERERQRQLLLFARLHVDHRLHHAVLVRLRQPRRRVL
jgi:hypothetical protein